MRFFFLWTALLLPCDAFLAPVIPSVSTTTTTTTLHAIGVLAKKAKEAELRQFIADGLDDTLMETYQKLKANMANINLDDQTPGPLQQELTKRAGTITVIAEYKHKNDFCDGGIIKDS